MKNVCPIISRECLEALFKVFPQLRPVVFGELFSAGWGPFCLSTVDPKSGVKSVDKSSEELGFEAPKAHPFPVGAGVDAVKGCTAVEDVGSTWFGEVRGGAVDVEERERGDVAGTRDLR